MDQWKFKDLPNTAVISTKEIIDGKKSINYVTHDKDDGGWQFINDSKSPTTDEASVVGLGDIVNLDPTIAELADLPLGWLAWRENKESTWQKAKIV